MYPIGHFAIAYFAAIISKKYNPTKLNILILWFFSVLPDFDIFIHGLKHRGPTHSIFIGFGISLVLLLIYRKGIPYCIALISHSIIDYFTSYGCQLLWPLNNTWYQFPYALPINSIEIALEIVLFLLMLFAIRIHLKKS